MTKNTDYHGFYYMMGMVLDTQTLDGELVASVPGVPAGYEIRMEPVGPDSFRLRGGPMNGAVVNFVRSETGEVTAVRAGTFELAKVPPEKAADLPVTERFTAPPFDLTPEKEAAFADLLARLMERADGAWVDYDLPYPKHEFVQYLMTQDLFIFHGSNNLEIETFAPVRKSMEMYDESGRGNLQAVYGTHDGLWSMFFAVVDRPRLRGSIRNGVMDFQNRAGETLSIYNFSINQEQLSENPWCEGALYLLPRDTFDRTKLTEETYANEWVSEQAVRPVAKLRLQPEDFPFLDRIGGHDDSTLIRSGELGREIRSSALSAGLQDDTFTVRLPAEMEAQLEEYVEFQRVMTPAANFALSTSDGALVLQITSLPPAVRQLLSEEYKDLLEG
jgi:hypothetical protein